MILTESAPVVVRFQIDDYTDALHFANQAERDQYSAAQIEAMCQARYANWQTALNAPRPAPTPEDVQAQLDTLTAQQIATQEQIIALAPPEIVVPILEAQQVIIAEQLATLTAA